MIGFIFLTYKNDVMPHGCNIHKTSTYTDMAIMCPFLSAQHVMPYWKYVLRCCETFPSIVIPRR